MRGYGTKRTNSLLNFSRMSDKRLVLQEILGQSTTKVDKSASSEKSKTVTEK